MRSVFVCALGMFVLVGARASQVTWTAAQDHNWANGGNWSPSGVPGSTSDVQINSSFALISSAVPSINSLSQDGTANVILDVNPGGSLTTGALNSSATALFTNSLAVNLTGNGTQSGAASLTLGGGSAPFASVGINAGGQLNLSTNAVMSLGDVTMTGGNSSSAILSLANGSNLSTATLVASSGGSTGITINGATLSATSSFGLSGSTSIYSGGTLNLTGNANLGNGLTGGSIDNGGIVAGNGILNLGSDLSLSGSTDGIIRGGVTSSSDVLTVNNTNLSSSTITIEQGTLTTSGGAELDLTGNMNLDNVTLQGGGGKVVLSGQNTLNGIIGGEIDLANGSVTTVSTGTISTDYLPDSAAVYLQGNADLQITNGATLQGGTYYLASGAEIDSTNGRLESVSVNGAGTWNAPDGVDLSDAVTTAVNGNLVVGGPGVTVSGGVLEGSGTITGNVTVTGGTIKPGDSPGTLTIDGVETLRSNSTTLIQVGGLSDSDFDIFNVIGTANLSGALDTQLLNLGNGYVPHAGDTFEFMTCTVACDGTFTSLDDYVSPTLHFALEYTGKSVDLVIENGAPNSPPPPTTPEPGTWLLMACGAVAFSVRRLSGTGATSKIRRSF